MQILLDTNYSFATTKKKEKKTCHERQARLLPSSDGGEDQSQGFLSHQTMCLQFASSNYFSRTHTVEE